MNLKSGFARVLAILAFAIAICSSSQAAQPSSTGSGRLVVQRSPAFGSKEFLQLSIDGKVHNIAPGSHYDQPISAGHHVLTVDAPEVSVSRLQCRLPWIQGIRTRSPPLGKRTRAYLEAIQSYSLGKPEETLLRASQRFFGDWLPMSGAYGARTRNLCRDRAAL